MTKVAVEYCPGISPSELAERTIECFGKETYEVPDPLHVLRDPQPEDDGIDVEALYLAAVAKEAKAETSDYGCFRIMSQTDGDKRVVWCRKVIAEIKAAKKMFMELMLKGMVPYKVGIDGEASSEEMKEFDPYAEEVIFMPVAAIAGG